MERDTFINDVSSFKSISTHTLTWSVTCVSEFFTFVLRISTHTLTWSVTDLTVNTVRTLDISTHTLTWSV